MDGDVTAAGLLSGDLGNIGNILAAISALGLAAFGLVDATKVFGGGASRMGFGFIEGALAPFLDAIVAANGAAGATARVLIRETVLANWLNGVAKAEQKAAAKALINLHLNGQTAPIFARHTGLDEPALKSAAEALAKGTDLNEAQLGALGRFNTIVSATLDMAYERADQAYRNASKLTAGVIAVVLSCAAGAIIFTSGEKPQPIGAYLGSSDFYLALLIGVISTPIAPIAKDISTSLSGAVGALARIKR
ncbi:MAG: hypothetical protein SFV19_06360 [Rhodospirillaceae bacterium]|nr:hypothetical protein [Rhodospirillaceae bacterium]